MSVRERIEDDDKDPDVYEVTAPRDRTITGETREQGLGTQLAAFAVGVTLITFGYYGLAPSAIAYVLGAFFAGVATERAHWMIRGRYETYRDALSALIDGVRP